MPERDRLIVPPQKEWADKRRVNNLYQDLKTYEVIKTYNGNMEVPEAHNLVRRFFNPFPQEDFLLFDQNIREHALCSRQKREQRPLAAIELALQKNLESPTGFYQTLRLYFRCSESRKKMQEVCDPINTRLSQSTYPGLRERMIALIDYVPIA